MFDYSERIESFRENRVRLPAAFEQKLLDHRKANRERLIARLPESIAGLSIGEASFKPQGSFAMRTVIQTKFADEEYDIDDGLVLWRHQLADGPGGEMSAHRVKELVQEALKDARFNRQPKLCDNCVRVFYADLDEEKHHVDFPIYRKWLDEQGNTNRELASVDRWTCSNPTQVNVWFEDIVAARNASTAGWGTQFRHLIQLLKRFCRSRPETEWDMPNGMKLTMLVAECQPPYSARIDIAFRELLTTIVQRLTGTSMVICNLAHPDRPPITKSNADKNVVELQQRGKEALDKLASLDNDDSRNQKATRAVWDWIFRSDGFFGDWDDEKGGGPGADRGPGPSVGGSGLASQVPKHPVDHRGGGRFGWS